VQLAERRLREADLALDEAEPREAAPRVPERRMATFVQAVAVNGAFQAAGDDGESRVGWEDDHAHEVGL
jgi:hypothetical protein